MAGRLDFVVFGATGVTGQYTVEELINLSEEKPATWGVAGRNKSKLEAILKKIGTQLEKDLSSVEIIVADVNDATALEVMALRAKVVINCCGPYRFWGEQVVKACIASGAHHVDISGEPQYMERMQLEYNEAARQKGVFIVSSCGFDSIPDDLGLVFLQNQFKGDLNSVESYVDGENEKPYSGPVLHFATYETVLYEVAHMRESSAIQRKLFPTKLPEMLPPLKARRPLFKSEVLNKWCLPFLGSDKSVMERSQRYFYESEKRRPVQVETYIGFSSLRIAMRNLFFLGQFVLLSQFSCGRTLLRKHPKYFSAGYTSLEGPPEEVMKSTLFSITLVGEGWPEHESHDNPPSKRMTVRVKGRNPGYGATCTCLVLSAYTILNQSNKMPPQGGVYPPGAAFAKTSLISELNKHGVTFEVLS